MQINGCKLAKVDHIESTSFLNLELSVLLDRFFELHLLSREEMKPDLTI